ncbi:MAG TPA: SGNH/GDSL hydrolase family protein, partial [Marmoricola sp.]|nr:SGNH/GDSL hydrolase family protein [Marmoricola sp.]
MRRLTTLLVVALLGLSGCGTDGATTGSDGSRGDPASSASTIRRYVALGDSYTAAPYVYLTDVANGCLRSNGNYPALLAQRLGVAKHVDVSCSGATSKDLFGRQGTFQQQTVPPQLAAVTRDTDLVTIGIGGNDFGLFGSLVGTCPISGPQGRIFAPSDGVRCGQVDLRKASADVRRIGALITRDLRAIHRKAPDATVVLVGYPRILDPSRSCPKVLPVAPRDTIALDAVTRSLSQQMKAAADRTGSVFVDLYAASKGHD